MQYAPYIAGLLQQFITGNMSDKYLYKLCFQPVKLLSSNSGAGDSCSIKAGHAQNNSTNSGDSSERNSLISQSVSSPIFIKGWDNYILVYSFKQMTSKFILFFKKYTLFESNKFFLL